MAQTIVAGDGGERGDSCTRACVVMNAIAEAALLLLDARTGYCKRGWRDQSVRCRVLKPVASVERLSMECYVVAMDEIRSSPLASVVGCLEPKSLSQGVHRCDSFCMVFHDEA